MRMLYHWRMPDLILTLIGPDRPGIVEAVAEAVASHGGNWLESRMAHLAGRFAGVLRVEAPREKLAALEAALAALEAAGLKLVVERSAPEARTATVHALEIELLGHDRPGLVREISDLLAERRVNVEELSTDRFSAPMSGELLFRARLRVLVPDELPIAELRAALERLAADLMVEIRLAEKVSGPSR
jgi:glycine cleavage system regulatory protein